MDNNARVEPLVNSALKQTLDNLPNLGKVKIINNCFAYLDIDNNFIHHIYPLVAELANQKIKKAADNFVIELEKTKDILSSLGENKKQQFLIGFALETENEIENAKAKIQKKNLDLIVLNSLQDEGAGFQKTTNKVTFIDKDFKIEPMELKSKEAVADDILNKVIAHFYE